MGVCLGDFEKAKISRFFTFQKCLGILRQIWISEMVGTYLLFGGFQKMLFLALSHRNLGKMHLFWLQHIFSIESFNHQLSMNVSWHNSCGNLEFSWTGNQLYHLFVLDELIPWPFLFALFWQTYICSNINSWWLVEDSSVPKDQPVIGKGWWFSTLGIPRRRYLTIF